MDIRVTPTSIFGVFSTHLDTPEIQKQCSLNTALQQRIVSTTFARTHARPRPHMGVQHCSTPAALVVRIRARTLMVCTHMHTYGRPPCSRTLSGLLTQHSDLCAPMAPTLWSQHLIRCTHCVPSTARPHSNNTTFIQCALALGQPTATGRTYVCPSPTTWSAGRRLYVHPSPINMCVWADRAPPRLGPSHNTAALPSCAPSVSAFIAHTRLSTPRLHPPVSRLQLDQHHRGPPRLDTTTSVYVPSALRLSAPTTTPVCGRLLRFGLRRTTTTPHILSTFFPLGRHIPTSDRGMILPSRHGMH